MLPEATVHQLTWPPPPEHCVGCVSVIDDAAPVGVIDDAQWTSVRSLLSARAALSCAWKRLFRRSSEREAVFAVASEHVAHAKLGMAVKVWLQSRSEIAVTGSGRTIAAIQRMVPAHAAEINGLNGWSVKTAPLDNGVLLTVTAGDPKEVQRVRGLGFVGILVSGSHHQPHHLAMAKGEFAHGGQAEHAQHAR